MKKPLAAAALTFSLVVGCQQTVVTTPQTPSQEKKDTNIEIRGPKGGKVDVHTDGKSGDTNVGVDIRRKDTRK